MTPKPTVNGKASICHWDLRVTFLIKKQATEAVALLLKEDIDFSVSFSTELDASRTLYVIEVNDMPWANNLATVASILQQVDYQD